MNAANLINAMDRFGKALPMVVGNIAIADARWKPAAEDWSILEVVRHLGDEEVDDFRTRLRITLENPAGDWPTIDPGGWAAQRKYNESDLGEAVTRFVNERAASVKWLRSLCDPDWSRAHVHPKFGAIHAGDLLAAWAAHDALHLRQIAKRLHQLAARDGEGFTTRYAGEW